MYSCPRCNVDLAPDAHYCPRCGFNQTNARIQKMVSLQGAQSDAPATSTSARTTFPSSLSIRQQMSPIQSNNVQQQEIKDAVTPSTMRPVRKNTPPESGKNVPVTPPIAGNQGRIAEQGQTYQPGVQTDQWSASIEQANSHIGEHPDGPHSKAGQEQADGTNAPELTLTKRYIAEQETSHQPSFPNVVSTPSEVPMLAPEASPTIPMPTLEVSSARSMQPTHRVTGKSEAAPQHTRPQREVETTSTMVYPSVAALDFDAFADEGAESLIATSKAAEHWRQSWRDRQHAEAGPAIGITRGQADVAEPLLMMQNSIARMRAIILPKDITASRGKNISFWITLILLICIIGVMSAYVISTYTPFTHLATQTSTTGNVFPTLTLQGNQTGTIKAGQTVHVHGIAFGSNHEITFIFATTLLSATPVESSKNGTFTASLTIPTNWLAGNYALQAQDNRSNLHAFLDLQVLPNALTTSNNTPLTLTINGLPLPRTGLTFKTVTGKSTTTTQSITLTNNSGTPVQWSASAIATNNLNWLVINAGKTGGTLDSNGTDSIGISVSTIGLSSSAKPYRGNFILTVNQTQAIVPVSLTVQNTSLEVVVNPDPVIAYLQGGGTCQPATLTLINLSNEVVTWNVNPYDTDKPHIHLDGLTTEQGTLDPEGLANDTKVIQITCIGAQAGEKLYHISVYYNGIAVNVAVTIRYA